MSALSGFVTGVIGLSLLDAVVSSNTATNNATGIFSTAAGIVSRLADPYVPAIPDRRATSGSQSSSSAPGVPSPAAGGPATPASFIQPATRLPVPVSA